MLYKLGVAIARRRVIALTAWGLVVTACIILYLPLQRALGPPRYAVEGSESQGVERLLEHRFPAIGTEDDALVFYSRDSLASQGTFRSVIAAAVGVARRQSGVRGVLGPYDPGAVGQIASNEHAAVAVVAFKGDIRQRYERAQLLQRSMRRVATASVNVWLTGYSPLAADLSSADTTDVERAEMIGVPVAFVVLLVAFGVLAAAIVPLLAAGAGLLLTYGVLYALSTVLHMDAFLLAIVTMIGVGFGIDYTLFIVSRFREELGRTHSVRGAGTRDVAHAVGVALDSAGGTTVISGAIVAASLVSLMLVKGPFFSEIAIGAVVVVCCMLSVALFLLPAVLATLGSSIDFGRVGLGSRLANATADVRGKCRRGWVAAVTRRPILAAGIAAMMLIFAALPVAKLQSGLNIGVLSHASSPAAAGEKVLARYFSPGAVAPVQVVVARRDGGRLGRSAIAAADSMAQALERDPRVSAVGEHRDHGGVLLTIVPAVAIDTPAAGALVSYIRDQMAPPIRSHEHVMVLVGGATAFTVDLTAEVRAQLPVVIALILALALVCLLIVFRSIAISIQAVVTNVFATGAALGALVVVFQEGHGERLLGFTTPGYIQVYMPLLVFALLFGLSMDYEVFLVRRIREEWERTHNNQTAVISGVGRTARPIGAAAAIMVAVFGCFVTANLLEIKQLGFALAIAVILDATVVRMVLVPSVMCMVGEWNWWLPGAMQHLLPGGDEPLAAPSVSRVRCADGPVGGIGAKASVKHGCLATGSYPAYASPNAEIAADND
jgi:putative drug exporter of the RND superfamily